MIAGLAALDLTYRAAVLGFLDEAVVAGWSDGDIDTWIVTAQAEGADGVWLQAQSGDQPVAGQPWLDNEQHRNAVLRLAQAFPVMAADAAVLDVCGIEGAWPVRPAVASAEDAPPPAQHVVVAPLFHPAVSARPEVGSDHDALWELHRLIAEDRVVLLMPPPTDGPGDESGALVRSAAIWSLAVAQGVRVAVTHEVGVARRAVDSVAEMLAGERGPVIVSFD